MFEIPLSSLSITKGKRRDVVREKERPQLKPMLLRACCYQVSQRLSAEIEGRAKFCDEKKCNFPHLLPYLLMTPRSSNFHPMVNLDARRFAAKV
jgi:hypothetical protein